MFLISKPKIINGWITKSVEYGKDGLLSHICIHEIDDFPRIGLSIPVFPHQLRNISGSLINGFAPFKVSQFTDKK
jgi:hypothetical protein